MDKDFRGEIRSGLQGVRLGSSVYSLSVVKSDHEMQFPPVGLLVHDTRPTKE